MRHQSKHRAALMRVWGPVRAKFVLDYGFCWVCGATDNLSCHEITRGIHRERALSRRCSWMCVDWKCNSGVLTDAAEWPMQRQLALKWLYDIEHFDLDAICNLMGRVPGCVTMGDVVPHICRLLD